MTKKVKRNLILIILGTAMLLLGITLIVLYQNYKNFSDKTINALTIIHEKIVLDYILVIIGSVLLAIPFFDKFFSSSYNLTEVKVKKPQFNKSKKDEKIKELETKIKELEQEKNQIVQSNDSQINDNQ